MDEKERAERLNELFSLIVEERLAKVGLTKNELGRRAFSRWDDSERRIRRITAKSGRKQKWTLADAYLVARAFGDELWKMLAMTELRLSELEG